MAEVGIFVGTMYGNSLLVAEEAEAILASQGHKATVYEDPELADWEKYQDKYILVVTSTTGQGDLPDSIVPLFQRIGEMLLIDAGEHPEPESESNPWVEHWATLLN